MSMKKIIVIGLILVTSLGLASKSWAQAGIYLGAYGGVDTQKPTLTGIDFNSDTSFIYGLRAGVRFLMLALELNYFQAAHNLSLNGDLLASWNNRQVDYSFIGLNLKYIFSVLMLHPYLTAGYGYYTADIQAIDKKRDGGYNLGLGLEIQLGKKFALLVEGKYNHVTLDIQERNLGLGDFTLVGGFIFTF
jgi:opacity protein-like surface antigen